MKGALQDVYLAWVQGAEETRGYANFASWAEFRLGEYGIRLVQVGGAA